MWFQPRVSRFRQLLDGSELHLITSEYPEELDPETIDIRVLWKNRSWPDRDVRPLISGDICPVCSPAFAQHNGLDLGTANSADQLSKLPLLH